MDLYFLEAVSFEQYFGKGVKSENLYVLFQTILTPQNSFYEKLAKECVESGVAVDLFLFPNAYIDVATIGSVATLTGGQIYRYSYFKVDIIRH